MNFLKYETDQIDQCLGFIKRLQTEYQLQNGSKSGKMSIMATGGGAYKYYDEMRRVLGVEVLREDEMDCLIIGRDCSKLFTYAEAYSRSSFRS